MSWNPLEQYTDEEMLAEIRRRRETYTAATSGQMAACATCGAVLWPNQTHACPTVIRSSAAKEDTT